MIERHQTDLFGVCRINPLDFWIFTPAETRLMVNAVYESEKLTCIRHAQILSTIYNANGCHKKGSNDGFSYEDFLPDEMIPKKKVMTIEDYWAKLQAANLAMGGHEVLI
jgi:hypothetical protein